MNEYADSYDQVASDYAAHIYHELDHKPLDRELLDRFARQVAGRGPVCDVGCGPGQVARYLSAQGVNVSGVDISPGMVAKARQLNPGLIFRVGDMCRLDFAEGALAGIVAFYAMIHIKPERITAVLREFKRVLQPGGWLLFSFHAGTETVHLDEWWEKPVSLDFYFFEREAMAFYTRKAGLDLVEVMEREPYPDIEAQTHRIYIFARNSD